MLVAYKGENENQNFHSGYKEKAGFSIELI
jgi:hypothetical protein